MSYNNHIKYENNNRKNRIELTLKNLKIITKYTKSKKRRNVEVIG